MAIFYIVSTPIGNLEDITKRALRILSEVDLILCEDTRITKRLLDHYEIKTPTLSYHQHSKLKKVEYIIQLLKEGKDLALVSDAGTPGISDPGNKLINLATKQLNNLTIIPIPGPSAVTAAASISGFPTNRFLFLGFPPTKKKRKRFFEEVVRQLADSKYPVIFYESPYRILKTLDELAHCSPTVPTQHTGIMNNELRIVVCRELTKKFETIYRGTIEEVVKRLKESKIRGEFVIIVERK